MGNDITTELHAILNRHNKSPFLFLGSGFSQRYSTLPTWRSLLEEFSTGLEPFDYYWNRSDSDLPQCASLIAHDYAAQQAKIGREGWHNLPGPAGALKKDIAEYVKQRSRLSNDDLEDELKLFDSMNIQGVITTNWDDIVEQLLPKYKVFVGQSEIVSGSPQNVGEIFKIHGCCSDPESLVLTKDDYDNFEARMSYLAAKLITTFIEHPVVFIGYSIQDKNIRSILRSIIEGLQPSEISKLAGNLIFVQRNGPGRTEGIGNSELIFDDKSVNLTRIVTDDFTSVYGALAQLKLKLPADVLRFCREQIYLIAGSSEPSEQLRLLDIDDVESREDVEIVVGIGISSRLDDVGYVGISTIDIFEDLIFDKVSYNPVEVLDHTLPNIFNGSQYLPIFKYLRGANLTPCKAATKYPTLKRLISRTCDDFRSDQVLRDFESNCAKKTTGEIISAFEPVKVAKYLACQQPSDIDMDALRDFLKHNFPELRTSRYSTYFRKAACLYDYLKYTNTLQESNEG